VELTREDQKLIIERVFATFTPEELALHPELLEHRADKEYRVALSSVDLVFFCKFYLGHHFTKPWGELHRDLMADVEEQLQTPGRSARVVLMPRGFGKTTLCTLGVPLWCVVHGMRHYITITSDSSDQAEGQLATLKAEIENNDRLHEDFGDFVGSTWTTEAIVTANDIRIDALGAGKKIRGRKYKQWRPDLMIFDDIENLEEAMSDAQRKKRKAWFRQDAMRAGWENTKVLVVGNMLHHACLLAELSKNPLFQVHKHQALISWATNEKLWAQWEFLLTDISDPYHRFTAQAFYEAHREAMDEGAISAWPEAFSYYDLMVMRASEGHAAFATELMNDPLDPSRTLFHTLCYYRAEWRDGNTWLRPLNGRPTVKLSDCWIFGATDPSMGKSTKADYTAIMVLAKAPNGFMFLLEAIVKRITPDQAIQEQNELAGQYNFQDFGIEDNQFQALFKSKSAESSLESGNRLPIHGLTQIANKELRIKSLEPDLTNGYIMFSEGGQELLVSQLREYPLGEYDDGPDALEMVRTMATAFDPLPSTVVIQAEGYRFGGGTSEAPGRRDAYEDLEEAYHEKMRELKELYSPEAFAYLFPGYEDEDEESKIFVPVTML